MRVSAKHLCLFTGLHDLNGEALYEEDWVRRESDSRTYQLQYRAGCFWLVGKRLSIPVSDAMRLTKVNAELPQS